MCEVFLFLILTPFYSSKIFILFYWLISFTSFGLKKYKKVFNKISNHQELYTWHQWNVEFLQRYNWGRLLLCEAMTDENERCSCQLVVGLQLDIGYLACGDQIATETTETWFLICCTTSSQTAHIKHKKSQHWHCSILDVPTEIELDSKSDLTPPTKKQKQRQTQRDKETKEQNNFIRLLCQLYAESKFMILQRFTLMNEIYNFYSILLYIIIQE